MSASYYMNAGFGIWIWLSVFVWALRVYVHGGMIIIISFIVSYCFYHFTCHFPYRFYQPSINQKPLTFKNDTEHLLTSAGVCLGPFLLTRKANVGLNNLKYPIC